MQAALLSGAHSKLLECCHLTGLRQAPTQIDLPQTCPAHGEAIPHDRQHSG